MQAGAKATFTVVASNATSYQWQASADGAQWNEVAGDGASLEVHTTDLARNGTRYRVVVIGPDNSLTSQAATLTVLPAPVQITLQPVSTSSQVGSNAVFTFQASGTDIAVRWEASADGGSQWTVIPGELSNRLVLFGVQLADNGKRYRAVIANEAGEVISAAAVLSVVSNGVVSRPAIISQPVDATVLAGQSAHFSVSGQYSTGWQWQVSTDGGGSWSDLNGARSAALVLPPAAPADNGKRYRAVATTQGVSTHSAAATLSVVATSTRNLARLAGQPGGAGYADGMGTDARFNWPGWTAADSAGNVYVSTRCAVRKIDTKGWVSTVSGSLVCGGQDGWGSAAFLDPAGLVALPTGELIVADAGANSIRRIAADGAVSTVAGSFTPAGGAADGVGAAASFNRPVGIAHDASGNLYVADQNNFTIRKITPTGVVSTYAGRPGISGSEDGSVETALLSNPTGVAVDIAGMVYVTEGASGVVRRISPQGFVTTVAGLAGSNGSVDGVGNGARFGYPMGIAVDASGTLFVADASNQTIRKIGPDKTVSTVAGKAGAAGASDDSGASARFRNPAGISIGPAGELYVADTWNQNVRKISAGGTVTTLAGSAGHAGHDDGFGPVATFDQPAGLAKDSAGNLYVADIGTGLVRKVTPTGVTSSFVTGVDYIFQAPSGVKVDAAGTLYVADSGASVIRRIGVDGTMAVLAGQPGVRGYVDGASSTARFSSPSDIVLDANGNLYVSDGSNTIRRLTPAGQVTTFAGIPGSLGSSKDGPALSATFGALRGLVMDSAGNLFAAEANCIRKVGTDGMVSTFAGNCSASGSSDGAARTARFEMLWGLDIDAEGNLYAADFGNHTIRKISPSAVVSTVIGTSGISSVVLGGSPLLNAPRGVLVLDANRLAISSENAILVFTKP